MDNTDFRPIPQAPDYAISREGEVIRLTCKGGWRGKRGAWPVGRRRSGYKDIHQRIFALWRDGKSHAYTTAQLVGAAFGIPRADLVDYARGERIAQAKLNSEDIPHIRRLYRAGVPTNEIGHIFGVAGRTIRDIRAGKIWRHIP